MSKSEVQFIAETFSSGNLFSKSSKHKRSASSLKVDNIFPILSENEQVLAYVVNFEGGGYNIVSATQKYAPIIGFSETGNIQQDYKNENPAFAFWMDYLKEDIICQINKQDDSDSTVLNNRILWRAMKRQPKQTLLRQE